MTEFKIGDRITWGGRQASYVVRDIAGDIVYFEINSGRWEGDYCTGVPSLSSADLGIINGSVFVIESVKCGPIRKVTRKKLVPGDYGRVSIDAAFGDTINLKFLTSMGKASGIYSFTTQELRDAARVFNDIADFLEEQKS